MARLNLHLTTIVSGVAALGLMAGAAAAQTPKRGGTAVVAIGSDASGINPVITTGLPEVTAGCMVYEGLTIFNTKTDLAEPGLAESWTISPDGRTYTFKLRKADWQDGKPFTSEDVRYTLMEVASKLGPVFSAQAGKLLEGVDTPDPQTAVIRLKEPFGPLLRLLSCGNTGAILPAHLFKDSDPKTSPVTQKPVGTGPFKFVEWVRGDRGAYAGSARR